jgi:arylsulfatase A-like enzyme
MKPGLFPLTKSLGHLLGALALALAAVVGDAETPKPNVLFIAVDDLNHWVGHLGRNPQTKTPHIDRLARMGVTFTHAYCAAPICNPSRTALLSGRRPNATGVYDNNDPFRAAVKAEESLLMTFKNAGYTTLGKGKIWHGGLGFPEQWDVTSAGHGREPPPKEDRSIGGIKFAPLDCEDAALEDTHTADFGIEHLGRAHAKPFFLALGFHKPHMPWNVPRKYFELHPLEKIELPPYREDDLKDLPPAGVKMAGAFGDHAKVLESGRWKEAVQAYLAAISYLDAQVGRVLDAFDKSAHATSTIVCFFGDHGWHLGEKHHWRKFALWEEATRAPFIWVAPGVTKPGGRCERTVDFMSIYPTLCDLAGIPKPGHVEGASIRKLLADPRAEWSMPALTTHGRNNHAVRTAQWRYIRYADGGEELYDEWNDPFEWNNLARAGDIHDAVKEILRKQLPALNVPPVKSK